MKLDAGFFEALSRFRLAMGHKSSMNLTGNRKSVQKGSSTEFSDFREYMPGDDIRRIDWNAYGRLDRIYIKEYMEEKEAVDPAEMDRWLVRLRTVAEQGSREEIFRELHRLVPTFRDPDEVNAAAILAVERGDAAQLEELAAVRRG